MGGSAIAAMQNQIKVDIPGLGNAQKKLDKAETARNATKKTRAKASKTLKSATADAASTGNTLIKTSEKHTKSIGKKLKSAAKSSTNKATYNTIAQAIREGKPVNLKGLKGSALKYAKSYNSSLKQGNTIASKVKAGKTVKTSGMSNILKSTAQAYNADAKEKASAQKVYDNAKKADEKALDDLTKAQKNKDKLYAGSTKEQQILATTKGKKSYVYQNMLLTQETKNLKEQNKQRQKALKETRDSYMKAKSNLSSSRNVLSIITKLLGRFFTLMTSFSFLSSLMLFSYQIPLHISVSLSPTSKVKAFYALIYFRIVSIVKMKVTIQISFILVPFSCIFR